MRHGLISPLAAVSLAALLAGTSAHAEGFDLFGFLKPQSQSQAVAETPIAEDAAAPLPAARPAIAPQAAATPAGAAPQAASGIAPLPEPQAMMAEVPLPQRRPKITPAPAPVAAAEPALLLLAFPAAKGELQAAAETNKIAEANKVSAQAEIAAAVKAAAEAKAAEAKAVAEARAAEARLAEAKAAAAPKAAPQVKTVAVSPVAPPPAAAQAPAEALVPPVDGPAIAFPTARVTPEQAPGVEPRPVRTIAIAGTMARRPAPAAEPTPAPVAQTAPAQAAPAQVAAAQPAPVPSAVVPLPAARPVAVASAQPQPATPAPVPAAAPAPAPIPVAAAQPVPVDPMPEVALGEARSTMSPEAMSAAILTQTEAAGLKGMEDVKAAQIAAAAATAARNAQQLQPPALPADPAQVADAMMNRIPTVTSAIAGIVSAVSPTAAHAGPAPVRVAQADTPAAASSAPAQAAQPDLTRVQRAKGPPPYEMVRRLQRLQDRIATGDTEALQNQRTLIVEIETAFHNAEPHVWQDPRNARAAVIFFLSGGGPAELRNLLKLNPLPAVDERLLQGALAYVEGRQEDAERYLSEINAMHLPDALGGQIAMAQAAVTVAKDPKKAMAMLDVARLLMPGTLVEEAALRREILVAAQLGDLKQFEQLSRQYLFRFRHSVYAGNFRQRFAAALTRMEFVNDPKQFSRLVTLLAPLDRDSRIDIYLMVARGALNQGKLHAAHASADKVLAEAPALSSDAERARVYRSAVRAASSTEVDVALAELRGAERSRLPEEDILLLNAAITTAELVKSAGETVKKVAVVAKPAPKLDPMKLTVPANGTPALQPRLPAAEQAAAAPAAAARPQPVSQPAPAAPQVVAQNTAAAAAPAAPKVAPLFDEGTSGSALVNRAQGALGNVDAMLKDAPR